MIRAHPAAFAMVSLCLAASSNSVADGDSDDAPGTGRLPTFTTSMAPTDAGLFLSTASTTTGPETSAPTSSITRPITAAPIRVTSAVRGTAASVVPATARVAPRPHSATTTPTRAGAYGSAKGIGRVGVGTPDALREETRLLTSAEALLRSGDAERALPLLEEHRRRFPHGALVEEREAAWAMTLCALGRKREAETATTEFVTRWPHSPLKSRVTAACSKPPGGTP